MKEAIAFVDRQVDVITKVLKERGHTETGFRCAIEAYVTEMDVALRDLYPDDAEALVKRIRSRMEARLLGPTLRLVN